MFYVEGFIELSQFGFMVRKDFNGFVSEEPTEVKSNGRDCKLIGDIPVPLDNIKKIMAVKVSGVEELDMSKLFPPATKRPIRKESFTQTPVYDEFVEWRKDFFHKVEMEFKDAIKAKEMRRDTAKEVKDVLKGRLEFYGASIQVAEKAKDNNLARLTFRYATQMANNLFIKTLSETGKEVTVKDLIKAFKEGANVR